MAFVCINIPERRKLTENTIFPIKILIILWAFAFICFKVEYHLWVLLANNHIHFSGFI